MSFNPVYTLIQTLTGIVTWKIKFKKEGVGKTVQMLNGHKFTVFRHAVMRSKIERVINPPFSASGSMFLECPLSGTLNFTDPTVIHTRPARIQGKVRDDQQEERGFPRSLRMEQWRRCQKLCRFICNEMTKRSVQGVFHRISFQELDLRTIWGIWI